MNHLCNVFKKGIGLWLSLVKSPAFGSSVVLLSENQAGYSILVFAIVNCNGKLQILYPRVTECFYLLSLDFSRAVSKSWPHSRYSQTSSLLHSCCPLVRTLGVHFITIIIIIIIIIIITIIIKHYYYYYYYYYYYCYYYYYYPSTINYLKIFEAFL